MLVPPNPNTRYAFARFADFSMTYLQASPLILVFYIGTLWSYATAVGGKWAQMYCILFSRSHSPKLLKTAILKTHTHKYHLLTYSIQFCSHATPNTETNHNINHKPTSIIFDTFLTWFPRICTPSVTPTHIPSPKYAHLHVSMLSFPSRLTLLTFPSHCCLLLGVHIGV